jgi:hypothetical protein
MATHQDIFSDLVINRITEEGIGKLEANQIKPNQI